MEMVVSSIERASGVGNQEKKKEKRKSKWCVISIIEIIIIEILIMMIIER